MIALRLHARPRKRTLAYTRVRRRSYHPTKNRNRSSEPVHDEIVIFDRGPAVFPVATLVPRDHRSRVRAWTADLGRWIVARWTWLRPRTVPVMAALLGATFVIASANYLHHAKGSVPKRTPSALSSSILAPP